MEPYSRAPLCRIRGSGLGWLRKALNLNPKPKTLNPLPPELQDCAHFVHIYRAPQIPEQSVQGEEAFP